jgi:hypothetical protein
LNDISYILYIVFTKNTEKNRERERERERDDVPVKRQRYDVIHGCLCTSRKTTALSHHVQPCLVNPRKLHSDGNVSFEHIPLQEAFQPLY